MPAEQHPGPPDSFFPFFCPLPIPALSFGTMARSLRNPVSYSKMTETTHSFFTIGACVHPPSHHSASRSPVHHPRPLSPSHPPIIQSRMEPPARPSSSPRGLAHVSSTWPPTQEVDTATTPKVRNNVSGRSRPPPQVCVPHLHFSLLVRGSAPDPTRHPHPPHSLPPLRPWTPVVRPPLLTASVPSFLFPLPSE